MKKILCILLMILFILPCALADTDYSKMTDAELKTQLNLIRNELNRRIVKVENKKYLIQDNDIEIYFTGKGSNNSKYFNLEVVFVNKTDKALSISFDNIVINGWEVPSVLSGIDSTGAGKKRKDEIMLYYTEADLESYKDMEDIEVTFHTVDEKYHTVKKYGPITFDFNGKAWN